MTSITRTIETSDSILLNYITDEELSKLFDFDTDPTPTDIELNFEDVDLPIQSANKEFPAESQSIEAPRDLTDLNCGPVALTAEQSLEPLVGTCPGNITDTGKRAVWKPKSVTKMDRQLEV